MNKVVPDIVPDPVVAQLHAVAVLGVQEVLVGVAARIPATADIPAHCRTNEGEVITNYHNCRRGCFSRVGRNQCCGRAGAAAVRCSRNQEGSAPALGMKYNKQNYKIARKVA